MAAARLAAYKESRRVLPLPTLERPNLYIPSSGNDQGEIATISESHGSKVERIGNVVIKYGRAVDPSEASAQRLAVDQLNIPVPRVFDCQTHQAGHTGISMEYIDGDTLYDIYPSLSTDQKTKIAQQLRDILVKMRSLEAGEGVMIGSCGNKPARVLHSISSYQGGPFIDEAAFNDFLASNVFAATPKILLEKFRRRLRTDHSVKFTHADLSQHNILVKNGNIVALLDWGYAGWYPEYWEYLQFWRTMPRDRDWLEYADIIFSETYDDELFLHQFLIRYRQP